MTDRTCSVDGCDKPPRSGSAKWCKMHYHRWYRHGSVEKTANQSDVTASYGRLYRTMYAPGHPLADTRGKAYVHRYVLYSMIGPGVHECHWCHHPVEWRPRGDATPLVPDHLNGKGDDNRPENLVPSCQTCNSTRAMQSRAQALRDAGWWSHHDTVARLAGHPRRALIP